MLSEILPASGKRFRFEYEYDFGDGWQHEILFRGSPQVRTGEANTQLCLEGARACPPEDVGGVTGYADFLETISDPENEEHDGLLEWAGGMVRSRRVRPGGCDQADEARVARLAEDAVTMRGAAK